MLSITTLLTQCSRHQQCVCHWPHCATHGASVHCQQRPRVKGFGCGLPVCCWYGRYQCRFDIRNSRFFSGTAPRDTRLGPCHQFDCAHFCSLGGKHRSLHLLPYTLWTCFGRKSSRYFQTSQSLWSTIRGTWSVTCAGLLCIYEHWKGAREGARVPI